MLFQLKLSFEKLDGECSQGRNMRKRLDYQVRVQPDLQRRRGRHFQAALGSLRRRNSQTARMSLLLVSQPSLRRSTLSAGHDVWSSINLVVGGNKTGELIDDAEVRQVNLGNHNLVRWGY